MRILSACAIVSILFLGCGSDADAPRGNVTDSGTEHAEQHENSETTDTPEIDPDKAEAMALGLSIIQSYFDNEPEVFIALIADTLPQIGRSGEVMDGAYFRELIAHATPYPSGEDLTGYTMEDYNEVHTPVVVTYEEAVADYGMPAVEGDGWIPEEGDLIYLGGILKEGKTEADKFVRDGLNSFVFGKRDGQWLFVGFVS